MMAAATPGFPGSWGCLSLGDLARRGLRRLLNDISLPGLSWASDVLRKFCPDSGSRSKQFCMPSARGDLQVYSSRVHVTRPRGSLCRLQAVLQPGFRLSIACP
jgi:hypothetical protein